MSGNLRRQMQEDRMLRDAAKALVEADVAHVKSEFSGKSLGSRFATRVTEGATELYEDAAEAADKNRGVLATLIAAMFIWFARNPIMAFFDDLLAEEDEEADLFDELPLDDGEEPEQESLFPH